MSVWLRWLTAVVCVGFCLAGSVFPSRAATPDQGLQPVEINAATGESPEFDLGTGEKVHLRLGSGKSLLVSQGGTVLYSWDTAAAPAVSRYYLSCLRGEGTCELIYHALNPNNQMLCGFTIIGALNGKPAALLDMKDLTDSQAGQIINPLLSRKGSQLQIESWNEDPASWTTGDGLKGEYLIEWKEETGRFSVCYLPALAPVKISIVTIPADGSALTDNDFAIAGVALGDTLQTVRASLPDLTFSGRVKLPAPQEYLGYWENDDVIVAVREKDAQAAVVGIELKTARYYSARAVRIGDSTDGLRQAYAEQIAYDPGQGQRYDVCTGGYDVDLTSYHTGSKGRILEFRCKDGVVKKIIAYRLLDSR